MNYKFKYKNTAFELFKLSLFYLYTSLAGVVNIIFTLAMFVLIYSRWNAADSFLRAILVLAVLFFVLFQPVMIYNRARKSAITLNELILEIGDRGIAVEVDKKHEFINWNKVRGTKIFPHMLIIFTDTTNGYILTKRIAGDDYKRIFSDIIERVKNN